MPMSRARSIAQPVSALLILATITIGVPAVLVSFAGWPLPTSVPGLGDVWTRVQQGDIPSATVVKALAAVVWLIWLQLSWALVWEVAVNLRRVGDRQPPKPAPLVSAAVGHGMSRLVAMIFSATVIVASLPAPSLAAPRHVAAPTDVLSEAPSLATPSSEPEAVAAESCWVVQPVDSLWRIAEMALGDGSRSNEILDLNSQLSSARDVAAGQWLRLPADAVIPHDRQSVVDPTVAAPALSYVAESAIIVEPGDTLWDLSTDRLEASNAVPPTPADIVDYVNRVVDRNPDVVEDPNLIYPGEVFVMPQLGTTPPPPPAPAPQSVEQPPTEPAEVLPPPETAELPPDEPPHTPAKASVGAVGGSNQVDPSACRRPRLASYGFGVFGQRRDDLVGSHRARPRWADACRRVGHRSTMDGRCGGIGGLGQWTAPPASATEANSRRARGTRPPISTGRPTRRPARQSIGRSSP
jgi:nucleoid-associated protein YgaU